MVLIGFNRDHGIGQECFRMLLPATCIFMARKKNIRVINILPGNICLGHIW